MKPTRSRGQGAVAAPVNLKALSALMAMGALSLGGCMNLSGLSGSPSYGCKAPVGVACDSVAGNYANAVNNNLPSQRARIGATISEAAIELPVDPATGAAASAPIRSTPPVVQPGAQAQAQSASMGPTAPPLALPLRSSARVLRLWFKPWEDADRDLYDQGYVYVQVDNGQWLIDHAQRLIREAHAPLRPPPRPAASAPDSKDGAAAAASPRGLRRLPTADHPMQGLQGADDQPPTTP